MILNNPDRSAEELADELENALDSFEPISSSQIEDAMIHLRILLQKVKILEKSDI